MVSLTIDGLQNGGRDLAHIAEIAVSNELTATDRFGQVKKTIAGVLASIPASGVIGKATFALLSVDLEHRADTVAYVTNDAIPENNTTYRKDGGIGVGVWVRTDASVVSIETGKLREYLSDSQYVCGYSSILPIPMGESAATVGPFVFADPVAESGLLTSVTLNAVVAGVLRVQAWSRVGDVFTRQRETTISVLAGYQIVPLSLDIYSGEHVGFSGPGIVSFSLALSDGDGWYAGSGDVFTDTEVEKNMRLHIRFDEQVMNRVQSLEAAVDASASLASVQALEEDVLPVASSLMIGQTGVIPAGDAVLSAIVMWALEQSVPRRGVLSSFTCRTAGAGSVRVMTYSRAGDIFKVKREVTIAVAAGYGAYPISLQVDMGDYVGFQSAVVQQLSTAVDPSGWFGAVGYQAFTDTTVSRGGRLLVGFQLDYRTGVGILGRPTAADLPWENMLVLGTGQSLIEGSQTATSGTVPITTEQEYDNLGFPAYPASPTNLAPATVATTEHQVGRGEWPGLGCAAAIRRALLRDNNLSYEAIKSTVVIANNAVGGSPIANLVRGTAPYASGIAQATALAALTGQTAGVLAVIFGQGESDVGTDPAVYRAKLIQLAADYDADLRAATGQSRRVRMVCYQLGTESRSIALAQLDAALSSDLLRMVGPMYQFDYYDGLHINSVSSRRLGAYYGEAVKAIAIDNGDWQPLRPISAHVLGNTIVLTFNKSGLVFDDVLVPAQPGQGFHVQTSALDTVPIVAVEVRNSNQVRIACATAPAADWVVQYGVEAVGKAPYFGRAGNLRDSAGDRRLIAGWPLHNWAVCFDWAL